MKITFKEKEKLTNKLDISLHGFDFVTLEDSFNIETCYLQFWKDNNNDTYSHLFKIRVSDFEKIIKFMDIADGSFKLDNKDYNNGFSTANLELKYTLVPNHYYTGYYHMKTFCTYILISLNENAIDGTYDKEKRKQNIWLPINSELWKSEISRLRNTLHIDVYVNGKLTKEPLSIETAKRLGIVK